MNKQKEQIAKEYRDRNNNKIEIISFKFAGRINGYFMRINNKELKEGNMIKTFKTIKECEDYKRR